MVFGQTYFSRLKDELEGDIEYAKLEYALIVFAHEKAAVAIIEKQALTLLHGIE